MATDSLITVLVLVIDLQLLRFEINYLLGIFMYWEFVYKFVDGVTLAFLSGVK